MVFFRAGLLILAFAFLSACGGGGGNSSTSTATSSTPTPALTISGSPSLSAEEDVPYSFNVTVGNASGNVQFRIENAPAWLKVANSGSGTGAVAGTPQTNSDTGVFENITISVIDDEQKTASLRPFRLEVVAVNDAPVVIFQQKELTLDGRDSYSIDYSVTDEEGDSFEVALSGITEDLNAILTDTTISGIANDVNEVRTGVLGVSVLSNGETFDSTIDVKIFPVTADGNGRTILGRKTGPGVNLVVLGDGYTADQMDIYRADAEDFITEMHLDDGIESHMSAWNIHVIETPSNQSGADSDFGTDTVDTYFGSGYNCANIQRLICANTSLVFSTAFQAYPNVDEIVLIVNDSRRGGSGGVYSIYARSAPAVALHEMGHSFANLRDEYVDADLEDRANNFIEGSEVNVSKSIDPNVVPWSHWIEDKSNYPTRVGDASSDTVGIFEGSYYNARGFYRPLGGSRMRSSDAFFGVVNTEAWIERIYATAGAVSDVTPFSRDVSGTANEDVEFAVQPLFNSDIQKVTWRINGVIQESFINESVLLLNSEAGDYVVEVTVEDVTEKVRKPSAIANYSHSWNVTLN